MMFLHDRRLPQLLAPQDYCSDDAHAREQSGLFATSWHPVGTTSELAADGAFITTTIADHPVIVWNSGGRLRAFLNVCSHRFSVITGQPQGCATTLKCQYHGWEYDAEGRTGRIPEAVGFRPIDAAHLCLRSFAVDTLGQMVFVRTGGSASLTEYLGEAAQPMAELFSVQHRPTAKIQADVNSNWKVVVENAVESYHLEAVHVKTFKQNPPARLCHHGFHDNGSTFTTDAEPVGRMQRWADSVMYGVMGLVRDPSYLHRLVYPSLMIGRAGMFTWCHFVKPTGPQTCQNHIWTFAEQGATHPLARLVSYAACSVARRFSMTAMHEDMAAAENVQRGLRSPLVPTGGCLSPREERVWHFQQHVALHAGHVNRTSPLSVSAAESRTERDPNAHSSDAA